MNRKYSFWGALLLACSLFVPAARAENQASFSIAQFELPASGQTPTRAPNQYPEAVRTEMITSCKQAMMSEGLNAAQAQRFCQCMVGRLQARYTLEQLTALNRQNGQLPEALKEVAMSCISPT